MVTEQVVLPVRKGEEAAFEAAFDRAQHLMAAAPGCGGLQLSRCVERPNEYLLLVEWDSVEAHTEGFRSSPAYAQWRALLHHFYDPVPVASHFIRTFSTAR